MPGKDEDAMKAIKWLKMCYSGRDMGAVYPVENEWDGFLFFYDEWGRLLSVHTRYNGILFEEVQ
jgi:hypothetical protein